MNAQKLLNQHWQHMEGGQKRAKFTKRKRFRGPNLGLLARTAISQVTQGQTIGWKVVARKAKTQGRVDLRREKKLKSQWQSQKWMWTIFLHSLAPQIILQKPKLSISWMKIAEHVLTVAQATTTAPTATNSKTPKSSWDTMSLLLTVIS